MHSLKLGCFIHKCYVGCLMYADDLVLISASVTQLQYMLDTCGSTGADLGMQFNPTQSHCLFVGPSRAINPASMFINGVEIEWVSKVKYLGITLLAGVKFSVDLSEVRRKFFAAANGVLSHCKFVSELVKMDLLEKHCLPILLYCVEVLNLSAAQLKDLNTWWNFTYRRVFAYNKWESVKELIYFLDRLEIKYTINMRHLMFLNSLRDSCNLCMHDLFTDSVTTNEIINTCSLFGVNMSWSVFKIKRHLRECFYEVVKHRLS